jgi:uncharacterized protein YqgC (DUF456 family)
MADATAFLLGGFGIVLLFLGLVGSILPIVPGPFLIWLGAFIWAWGNGFERIGWPVLIILGLMTVVAWASDLFLNAIISRRAGASWKSIGGAIAGGLLGGLLLSVPVPIIGTLIGAAVGAVAGMWFIEYLDKRSRSAAWRAVRAYIASMALAAALELALSLSMLAIFVWQAFM